MGRHFIRFGYSQVTFKKRKNDGSRIGIFILKSRIVTNDENHLLVDNEIDQLKMMAVLPYFMFDDASFSNIYIFTIWGDKP